MALQNALLAAVQLGVRDEVVILENATDDQTWAEWQQLGGWQADGPERSAAQLVRTTETCRIRVVRSQRNHGFAHGNNVILSLGRAPSVYVSVNPDCALLPGALASLCAAVGGAVAVAGGAVELIDEFGNVTTWQREGRVSWITGRALASGAGEAPPYVLTTYIGGCAAFDVAALKRVGGFPSELFLYYDEAWLTMLFHTEGLAVRMLPQTIARHASGSATKHVRGRPSALGAYWAARSSMTFIMRWRPALCPVWLAARVAYAASIARRSPEAAGATIRGCMDAFRERDVE